MRSPTLVALGVLFATGLAAHADTLTQTATQTYTNDTGPVEATFGIALFDPALGSLNSVTQTVSGNIVFTPDVPGESFYVLDVTGANAVLSNTREFTGGQIFQTATSKGPILEESTDQFGQQYVIEDFDLEVIGGTVSSVGPVTDTFTFNYTPAVATTPEPSAIALFGTGLLGLTGVLRKRAA